jgi:hypothetical protein
MKTYVLLAVTLVAACRREAAPGQEVTCRVNAVCFVCPDEQEKAKCVRDPATSRCKWADPSHCAK